MANKLKKEFHAFLLSDYEKEEEYLRKMHNKGYKLVKVKLPGFYYFEKCEPEDVVYRLDFNPQKITDKQNYLQMYEDYGWEYMQDLNEFSYFRKASNNVDDKDIEIFSDSESRLDMMKRIITKRMIPLMIIFLLCVLPQIINMIDIIYENLYSPFNIFSVVFCILWIMIFIMYLCMFVHCGKGFYKLKKKYSNKND
ncbi:MAG: DUF2812 domain-containing protein [Acutalibacteraceae bacterium]|nr:DUF2812 domain-containing protein [Acutalibacteraceae bacterium]